MVASYDIDTFGMPCDRSREVWREIVDGTFNLDESRDLESGYKVATRVWLVEEILFSKLRAEANSIIRTRAIIASNPAPLVKVRLYLRGSTSLQIDGETFMLGSGAVHFFDHDRPSRQLSTDHEQYSVFVPHHAIGYDPSLHPAAFSLGLDTAPGRLLEASLKAAFRELDQLESCEAPAFAKSLIGTIGGAMFGVVDDLADRAVRKARLSKIRRFIDQHLYDISLDANRLERTFNVSRATLFRDFSDLGGVNRYINDRRISRAYRDLSETLPARGVVQAVAERWGFSSLAHFSRVFKEKYHIAPTSVVGRWVHKAQNPPALDSSDERMKIDSATVAALNWSYRRFR